MKLYKYCSAKSGIEIIRKSRVLLRNPSDFNDPFDSVFDISDKDIEESKKLILNYEMFKGLFATFHRNDLKLSSSLQKVIINGLRKEFDICRELMKKTQTYDGIPGLNGELKRLANVNPLLKNKIEKIYSQFEEKMVDPVKVLADQALVSCFSKKPDSILMWSHYSNSHKGICIEIEEDRKEFLDVKYSKTRVNFSLVEIIKRILAADYLNINVDLSNEKLNYKLLEPFFTKSTDWKYEEEVRCVLSGKNPQIEGYDVDDCVPYLNVKISKIYIGINTKKDELNEILKLAMARDIPVAYMEKHPTDYALVINENKKIKPNFKTEMKKNSVEMLFSEMAGCLDSDLYIPALIIGLSLPGIMGSVLYPNLDYKDAYVKFFRETYEFNHPQEEPGSPYVCGELCIELKDALLNRGTIKISHHIKDFDLEKIRLKTEKKHNLQIFTSCITKGTHADGTPLNSIEINIREYCTHLPEICKQILIDKKAIFDKIPQIDIFDFDKEYNDMVECSIHSKTINDQILKYVKAKFLEQKNKSY